MIEKSIQTFVAIALVASLFGCEQQGPAESAGEQIDEAIQDSKRAVEDATD